MPDYIFSSHSDLLQWPSLAEPNWKPETWSLLRFSSLSREQSREAGRANLGPGDPHPEEKRLHLPYLATT